MNTVFVLIMIFGGNSSGSGYATIQQEFSTLEKCEHARKTLATIHNNNNTGYSVLRTQGCFAK
jgi:hypothetical protein